MTCVQRRKNHRFLGLLLAVLICLTFSAIAYADAPANAQTLTLDTPAIAEITEGGAIAYFSFIPEESGYYSFISTSENDTYGYLYDEQGNELKHNDDDGEGNNFKVVFALEAGAQYYYGARYYSSDNTGSYSVTLTKYVGLLSAEPVGDSTVYVSPYDTATLEVTAACNSGELSYQWYKRVRHESEDGGYYYSDELIENATGSSYTTEKITEYTEYYCQVSDQYGNRNGTRFWVGIENHLTVTPNGSDNISVSPNSTATLSVTATCDTGDLSYQWYKGVRHESEDGGYYYSDELIENATGSSYTTEKITEYSEYYCQVSDQYSNWNGTRFWVGIENHLTVTPNGSDYISVSPNSTATLSVTASYDVGPVSYQWYGSKYYWNADIGGSDYGYEPIADATAASYTTEPITRYTEYYCEVSDTYGNRTNVWFAVRIDNNLTAYATGNSQIKVEPNTSASLQVTANCASGSLSYQWYKINSEYYNRERVTDATENSYTTPPITKYTNYECEVTDEYGNSTRVWFSIGIENHLNARAIGGSNVGVPPNSSATLRVTASCDSGELTYQWYSNRTGPIANAKSGSFTTGLITDYDYYYCIVEDEYGNTAYVWFYVSIDNHLFAEAADRTVYVSPNSTATLKVNAGCDLGTLNYQWYGKTGEGYGMQPISGAITDSYTTEAITGMTSYFCRVTDQYNESRQVYFTVKVNNNLQAGADGNDSISVNPGAPATLTVEAACDNGKPSYQWYQRVYVAAEEGYDDRILQGETSDSLTIDQLNHSEKYTCIVTDQYGNSKRVLFDASVDSGFYANQRETSVLSVQPNAITTLHVDAGPKGAVSYQWSRSQRNEYGNYIGTEIINYATTGEYTTDEITGNVEYYCNVSDQYGNEKTLRFMVVVDNGLTVTPVGSTDRYVTVGERENLQVQASCNSGDLSYSWYRTMGDNINADYNGIWYIDSETASCTTDPITTTGVYRCVVRDQYGNVAQASFVLRTDNEFTASPVGNPDVTITEPCDVPMAVSASCTSGGVNYQWYRRVYYEDASGGNWRSEMIEGATKNSFTARDVNTARYYFCEVEDDYGNAATVEFNIKMASGLVVEPVGDTLILGNPGTDVTLQVNAQPADSDLWYQWYMYEYVQNENYSNYAQTAINNANTDSLKVTLDHFATYTCQVTDEVGSVSGAAFRLMVIGSNEQIEPGVPKTTTITEPGRYAAYSFTPTVSGEYVFTADAPALMNALVFDNSTYVKQTDNAKSIRIVDWLEAEHEYTFAVNFLNMQTGSIQVLLAANNQEIQHADNRLLLPDGLKTIENEAFANDAGIEEIVIPDGCESIGSRAFANCASLCLVSIPDSVTSIADNAFMGCNVTILCESKNAGWNYAAKHGYNCVIG